MDAFGAGQPFPESHGEKWRLKKWAYLETSIWSRLIDREDPVRRRLTRSFMARARRKLRWFASAAVTAELKRTRNADNRQRLARQIRKYHARTVTRSLRMVQVMKELMAHGVGTEARAADMLHVALGITGCMAYLVSWDERHLANPRINRLVRVYCHERGYNELRIGTPVQVAKWTGIGLNWNRNSIGSARRCRGG